jgi:hypothetical protein
MKSRYQTASTPARSDRRLEHHRERQATKMALHVPDLEEVLDPPSAHNHGTPISDSTDEANRRISRHQKQPFWKRGTKGLRTAHRYV